jgi:hypothetical protein
MHGTITLSNVIRVRLSHWLSRRHAAIMARESGSSPGGVNAGP